jgi:hypothetical protein
MNQTITFYVHQKPGEPQRLFTNDMSEWPLSFGVVVGTFETVVEWQAFEQDPTPLLIEHYQREIDRETTDHHCRVHVLNEQINRLLCLSHDAPEPEQ